MAQALVQTLLTQTWSGPQLVPHVPQLALSVLVLAQYGGPASGVQSVWPVLHALVQVPLEQTCCAPHKWPHEPQFWLSVLVLAQ